MNDDAKKKILARRAKFVAAAIAGIGVACGKQKAEDQPPPGPCLSVAYFPDAGTDAPAPPPRPCLQPVRRGDAGPCKCAPGDPLCTCL